MRTWKTLVLGIGLSLIGAAAGMAQKPEAPVFTPGGELMLPDGYREWVQVGMGLGMTYGPSARKADTPLMFDNIYVPRDAYRAFIQSGKWPEGTILVKEGRKAENHELLANVGTTQGEASYLEAIVKDSARFPDTTWAFFAFGGASARRPVAKPIPKTFDCYVCHVDNTAVEKTFVQHYPELMEAAKKFGTVKAGFDPKKKF
jgi:hypothetical protein